jgi:hypothetical protein
MEQLAANTREFIGDGTPYLKVPGCVKVESVRVGQQVIPLAEIRNYPTDATLQRFDQVTEPMIALEQGNDGTPVLMRSQLSNDGIWQKDKPVYVTAQWSDGQADPVPSGSRTRRPKADEDAAA